MSHTRSVHLRWTGEGEAFEGQGASGVWIPLDGGSVHGPGPTEALLLSLAACMAIDIRMILEKGRVAVEALEVAAEGDRRSEPPRYFEQVRLTVRLRGPAEGDSDKIQRAVDLSRDKYCSVLHSLRQDLGLTISVERF